MPETTIPVRLLIEQVKVSIDHVEKMANMSAQMCQKNKIEWITADDEMWARQSEIDVVHNTISLAFVAAGLTEAANELATLRDAAKQRIQSARDELRTNCLFNGPLRPRALPFSGRVDPFTNHVGT